jgi:hypothetical protein
VVTGVFYIDIKAELQRAIISQYSERLLFGLGISAFSYPVTGCQSNIEVTGRKPQLPGGGQWDVIRLGYKGSPGKK